MVQDIVEGSEDGNGDSVAGAEDLSRTGGRNAFGGLMQLGEDLFAGLVGGEAEADAVVARELRRSRGHEVADAAQAQEGEGFAARGNT